MTITRKSGKRRWWHILFPPSENPQPRSWAMDRVCTATMKGIDRPHQCKKRGPHYDHVCAEKREDGEDCGFRWAG